VAASASIPVMPRRTVPSIQADDASALRQVVRGIDCELLVLSYNDESWLNESERRVCAVRWGRLPGALRSGPVRSGPGPGPGRGLRPLREGRRPHGRHPVLRLDSLCRCPDRYPRPGGRKWPVSISPTKSDRAGRTERSRAPRPGRGATGEPAHSRPLAHTDSPTPPNCAPPTDRFNRRRDQAHQTLEDVDLTAAAAG